MSIFVVSFRFAEKKTVLGSYQERYDSFVTAVKNASISAVWDGTSSFIIIESTETAAQLRQDFDLQSMLDANEDQALIINLSQNEHAVLGAVAKPQLATLMSKR